MFIKSNADIQGLLCWNEASHFFVNLNRIQENTLYFDSQRSCLKVNINHFINVRHSFLIHYHNKSLDADETLQLKHICA